jgi:hypothetical protein
MLNFIKSLFSRNFTIIFESKTTITSEVKTPADSNNNQVNQLGYSRTTMYYEEPYKQNPNIGSNSPSQNWQEELKNMDDRIRRRRLGE